VGNIIAQEKIKCTPLRSPRSELPIFLCERQDRSNTAFDEPDTWFVSPGRCLVPGKSIAYRARVV
jgi:hypothetical protein